MADSGFGDQVLAILHDIKATQKQILERLDTLERRHSTTSENLVVLTADNNRVKEDLAQKFAALNLAVYHSAGRRLIGIPELLEIILLCLPMRDLLLAQRVNHQFKNTINSSVHLQRALYFEALPIEPSPNGAYEQPVVNPLLREELARPPSQSILVVDGQGPRPFKRGPYVELRHIGVSPQIRDVTARGRDGVVPGYQASIKFLRIDPSGASGTAKLYPIGSWRRMYATQPPCRLETQVWLTKEGRLVDPVICTSAKRIGELWSRASYCEQAPATAKEVLETWYGSTREVGSE